MCFLYDGIFSAFLGTICSIIFIPLAQTSTGQTYLQRTATRPTDLRVAISMASKSCPELTAVAPAEISSEAGEVIPTGPLYVVWRVSSVEPSGNRYGCIKAGEGRPPSSRGRRGSRQRPIGPIILYVSVWHNMYIYTRED